MLHRKPKQQKNYSKIHSVHSQNEKQSPLQNTRKGEDVKNTRMIYALYRDTRSRGASQNPKGMSGSALQSTKHEESKTIPRLTADELNEVALANGCPLELAAPNEGVRVPTPQPNVRESRSVRLAQVGDEP